MVTAGQDVDKLISEWHKMFTMGGLLATLPWLVKPIISNPVLKPLLMPSHSHPTNSKGSEHVISVSLHFLLVLGTLWEPEDRPVSLSSCIWVAYVILCNFHCPYALGGNVFPILNVMWFSVSCQVMGKIQ